jgi:dTDP-4-dehydrorhamnose reductase
MNADRHVLITGGAGYIGSLLTSELLRANYRVTVLDSLLFGGERWSRFCTILISILSKSDVTEPRAIRDNVRGEWPMPRQAIVHLAAIVGFPACQAVGPSGGLAVQRRCHENGLRAGGRPGRRKMRVRVHLQQLWPYPRMASR